MKNQSTATTQEHTQTTTPSSIFANPNLPHNVDQLFDDCPQESFRYYLGIDFELEAANKMATNTDMESARPKFFDALTPEVSLQKAFVYGYVSALHKSHTYSPALLLHGDQRVNYVIAEVTRMPESFDYIISLRDCITDSGILNPANLVHVRITELPDAFLAGYQAAFVCHGKYDRCLFLEGTALRSEVFCGLTAYLNSEENARRATARIVMRDANRQKFRTMLFGTGAIDDQGNPVPTAATNFNGMALDTTERLDDHGNPIKVGQQ